MNTEKLSIEERNHRKLPSNWSSIRLYLLTNPNPQFEIEVHEFTMIKAYYKNLMVHQEAEFKKEFFSFVGELDVTKIGIYLERKRKGLSLDVNDFDTDEDTDEYIKKKAEKFLKSIDPVFLLRDDIGYKVDNTIDELCEELQIEFKQKVSKERY